MGWARRSDRNDTAVCADCALNRRRLDLHLKDGYAVLVASCGNHLPGSWLPKFRNALSAGEYQLSKAIDP